jgi:ketosteroid isomerase-like protein
MDRGGQGPAVVVERLLAAINAHDLEAMVACFADDYVNEWPAHPQRGFRGRAQVRQNWSQIFAGVPDLQARLPRMAVDGDTVWTEWDIAGTRGDGAAFLMRGVSIFGVADGRLA